MTLKKNTHLEDGSTVHTWTDDEFNFTGIARKGQAGFWFADAGKTVGVRFLTYRGAVDFIMDAWRLAKAGSGSLEEVAQHIAEECGYDWELLAADDRQGFVEAARAEARQ